jgi:tetratricopeptide (TPR) repeat protein
MPTKIKVLWVFCCVLIVLGFITLSFKNQAAKAKVQAEKAFKQKQEQQAREKIILEKEQRTVVHPLKDIKELNALGKHKEAAGLSESVAELNPDNTKIYTWWGISLVKDGQHDEAIKKFVRAIELDASNNKAYLYWGLTLAMTGDHSNAINKLEKSNSIKVLNSNGYNVLVNSLLELGEVDRAWKFVNQGKNIPVEFSEEVMNRLKKAKPEPTKSSS